jgi:hypothetical protein
MFHKQQQELRRVAVARAIEVMIICVIAAVP